MIEWREDKAIETYVTDESNRDNAAIIRTSIYSLPAEEGDRKEDC